MARAKPTENQISKDAEMFDDKGEERNEESMTFAPDPKIHKPICLFGVGRTGTTIMMHILAQHRALAWFSSFHQKMPRWPGWALYSRITDFPLIRPGMPSEWSLLPKPSEGARVVRYLTGSKVQDNQQLVPPGHASPCTVRKYRSYVKSILRYQGKSRFLQKHTGSPRIRYFSDIFPDARFVHITRDGRAVAYSLTKAHWWDGTMKSWRLGEMDAAYKEEYLAANMEPIVLAAIVWKTLMRHIQKETALLPGDRYMEVRYDRIVAEPLETMKQICRFCELPFEEEFQKRVTAVAVHDSDAKWRIELSPHQIELLDLVLGNALRQYSFKA